MITMSNRTEILNRIEKISGSLEQYSSKSEELRRLPDEIVQILKQTGLFTMKLSADLGGLDTDIVTYMDAIEELSRIDGSIGWNTMIGNSAIGRPGSFLEKSAIDVIFKNQEIPLAASVPSPSGKAVPTDEGYILSGTWSYASGISQSVWVSGGFTIENEPPRIACMLATALEIHDNWQVMGLKGTGSCSYTANELFVPKNFTFELNNQIPLRGGPMNYLGRPGFVTMDHAAVCLGIAKRSLETITEMSKTKLRGYNSDLLPVSDRGYFKKDLGLSKIKLSAARALVKESHLKGWEYAEQGIVPPPLIQSEMRTSGVYASEIAEEITHMAFKYGGGEAIYLNNNLQKYYRDACACAQHMMSNQSSYENYANFILDVEDADPMGVKSK